MVLLVSTLVDWVISLTVLLIHRVLFEVVETLALTLREEEWLPLKWVHHWVRLFGRVLHVGLWLQSAGILTKLAFEFCWGFITTLFVLWFSLMIFFYGAIDL
jgi:hypothetical protein